jgi:hypothetical protein
MYVYICIYIYMCIYMYVCKLGLRLATPPSINSLDTQNPVISPTIITPNQTSVNSPAIYTPNEISVSSPRDAGNKDMYM